MIVDDEDVPLELETEDELRQRRRQGKSPAADGAGRGARRWPGILAVSLLALGGLEVGATLVQRRAAPTAHDWGQLAARLARERKPDEPVLFAPLWIEPLGRHHIADLELELLLLSDVERHRRVFEVSGRGARHPWLAGEQPARSWDLGALRLSLFERASPDEVLHDLTRRVHEARVERIGAEVTRCPWNAQQRRFLCDPARGWNWVGPHLAEVGHRPYRCIFAHAVDGHVMRVSFPSVAMGTRLIGYTGIDDFENRKRSDVPVRLKVLVGPQQIGEIQHQSRWPWHRFTIDTRELAGQTHPLSFEVTTERAFARTFCFAAETRK